MQIVLWSAHEISIDVQSLLGVLFVGMKKNMKPKSAKTWTISSRFGVVPTNSSLELAMLSTSRG